LYARELLSASGHQVSECALIPITTEEDKMRILFVANVWSIHTARWINQLNNIGWDLHIFPTRDLIINPILKDVTVHDFTVRAADVDASVRTPGVSLTKKGLRFIWKKLGLYQTDIGRPLVPEISSFEGLDKYAKIQGHRLVALIQKIKPDLVHSLQFQYDSYPALEAKKIMGEKFPTWIATNWGADIHHFSQFPDHAKKIREVLEGCDYYSCECYRDVELAQKLGFKGRVLPIIPNTGGYNLKWVKQFRQPGPTSARKVIALKGYKDWVYKGLVGLEALNLCKDILFEKDYKVEIYLGGTVIKEKAEEYGLPFEMVPYSPHEDILRMHGRSRVSIGLSLSDAISTSFLETIVMGSFPIQSYTSCADEWIKNGETGFLVPPEDASKIAKVLRVALLDDELVDQAAEINSQTVAERLNFEKVRPIAIEFYRGLDLKNGFRKAN